MADTPTFTKEELAALNKELLEQAQLQQKISESAGDYLKLIKEIKIMRMNISSIEKQIAIQTEKVTEAEKDKTSDGVKNLALQKQGLKILDDQLDTIKKSTAQITKAAKETGNLAKTLTAFKGVKDNLTGITNLVKLGYGKLKNWGGLFDMDKSLRMSAMSMGLLSKQTAGFYQTIQEAASSTISFGVGIQDLAKLQASYSEAMGSTVQLSKEGAIGLAAMGVATGLGAEGAAQMAADMAKFGYSASGSVKFVDKVMNDSHKMGLNGTVVIKAMKDNMGMMNQYQFKGGLEGLEKMAQTVTKLGVGMNFVSGMADNLFDIEGAVNMSAQLQVLGGAWAKLADPFHLMFLARNDMGELAIEVGKAAESSVSFNKAGDGFKISAMEMQRLKIAAKEAGASYDDFANAAFRAKRLSTINSQIRVNVDVDPDTKEFITNTAKFDHGKAYMTIGPDKVFLDKLTSGQAQLLKAQMLQQSSLKDRADASQNFDDQITNIEQQFKQLLLPLVFQLDKQLGPMLKQFSTALSDPKVVGKLMDTAKTVGKVITDIAKFAINNPVTTLLGFGMFEAVKWFKNGLSLSAGFNAGNKASGWLKNLFGGGGGGGGLLKEGEKDVNGGMFGKGNLGYAIGGQAIGMGAEYARSKMDNPNSTGGKALGIAGTTSKWAGAGASMGSFIGPEGTAIGAIAGGALGLAKGLYDNSGDQSDQPGQSLHDGIFGKPLHDGLSSDFSMGRGLIQGGKIHPIDNKDDLLAMKPKGVVANAMANQSNSTMNIEFGDIHFKFDDLKVVNSNGDSVSINLLKDPQFIRDITRMVHSETSKAINGGKVKG